MVQQLDWERPPVFLDNKMNLRALSSGEYAMVRFATQAAASIERGSLLLLDEPETHLHPNFVSDLMQILYQLLESTCSLAIVATHSAYVVREAPRQRVNILSVDDRFVAVDRPRLQTFGASVDKISQFVFNDTSTRHRYQRVLGEWADQVGQTLGIDRIIDEHGNELNSESLSFIARHLRDRAQH